METKRSLDGFQIKFLALVLMLLDHIHYIFEFTGKIPVVFSWLGRISGGLFLFTMVEGYSHTSNKKKYFMRIYAMSIFMGIIKYILEFTPALQRGDGFFPINGIFQSFVVLIVIFTGIDLFKENKIKGVLTIISPFVFPFIYMYIIQALNIGINIKNIIFIIISTLIPSPFMVEGGIFILFSGIILYLFRKNRKKQALFFFLFHFLWMTILPILYIEPMSLKLMFTDYYEWMGAFASIIMLMYNGEKGRSMKWLFYIFYPAHIYILYILSLILYKYI